jgi:D-alanyl-lipoteichoic acid acyltransferase DltB (MBOAT superfamily)
LTLDGPGTYKAPARMLFNSFEFALFLPLTLAIYYLAIPAHQWRARKVFVVVASYAFYMSWHPFFGLLLLASTLVDFTMGLALERTTRTSSRRALLCVSLAFNLGMLGYYKYGTFVGENLHRLLGRTDLPSWNIVLPIGISFYTFESLAYTINVYRGERASRSFLDFALFLSFFPHLVAGPIVRPRAFLPQLASAPRVAASDVELALARIAQGFVKKLLLADVLGRYVDAVWADMAYYPSANVLLAFYAYAFQIYFDFSGYTDIALGVSRLFGLTLPENFQRPYLAASPREFWQRWHVSLSTWLRDYLYVSLGGNRRGRVRTYVNLLATMLLGGLWHGAAWTFVVWGGYHGALLVLQRLFTNDPSPSRGAAAIALARLGTFHLVVAGWVLFRAPSLSQALLAFQRLGTGWKWETTRYATEASIVLVLAVWLHCAPAATRVRARFVALSPWNQGALYATATLVAFLLAPPSERFIYFQF